MNNRFFLIALAVVGLSAAGLSQANQVAAAPSSTFVVQNSAVPENLTFAQRGGWMEFWQRFAPANVGLPDLRNTAAWQKDIDKGTVYLSLQEVLRLALTADLDVADAAYAQLLAKPDYYRTLAGGSARGVAGEQISAALFSGAIGANGGGGGNNGGSSAGSVSGGGSGVHGGGGGYDPSFFFSFADEHSRQPLANPILFGTAVQILNQAVGQASFGQSYTTGTGYTISAGSFRSYQNTNELFLNPQVTSDISVGVQQRILNGGNRSVNRAGFVMGQNSLRYADANFKLQITNIVAQAATQYWTLVAAARQLEIEEQSEQQARQTLDDTTTLINLGKVAGSNRITAQLAFSAAEQARIQQQTAFDKAASKLKSFLTKQWSPTVIEARMVPTDALPSPTQANLAPVSDLINRAVSFSPQLAEDRINVSNYDLTVKIRKDGLLPSLAVFASYTSSGVSGLGVSCDVVAFPCPAGHITGPLPGGFGKSVNKIFSYSAPDYGVGFQLNVPVWNRLNRSDEATAEIQAAQSRVDLQKDQNTVTELVNEDRIELEGQVAQLQSAQANAREQQQSLSDAQDKYKLGKAALTDVLTAQSALATAQLAVVTAQQAYAVAQVALAKDSGTLLDEYHISLGVPLTPQSVGKLH
ncbi:MAG TPA: TolC family protein [Terriglobales bacterium]|nr:TolC family protein [Terriglobales bacterium]